MSDATEDPVKLDIPQEEDIEDSRYRSYREEAKEKAKASQKFKIGRVVWFKTDSEGSFRMTVMDAAQDPDSKKWSYKLKDSMGDEYEGWHAETKLTGANPNQ